MVSFEPLSALCAWRAVGLCIANGMRVMAVRKSALGFVRVIVNVVASTFAAALMSELSPYPPKTVMS